MERSWCRVESLGSNDGWIVDSDNSTIAAEAVIKDSPTLALKYLSSLPPFLNVSAPFVGGFKDGVNYV